MHCLEIEPLFFNALTQSLTYVLSSPVFKRKLNQTFGIIFFTQLPKKKNWPLQRACGSQLRGQFASIKVTLLRCVTIDFLKILYLFFLVGYAICGRAISSFARSPHCSQLRPLLRTYERWTCSKSNIVFTDTKSGPMKKRTTPIYTTYTSPIMRLLCFPKFCVSIIFNFSWDGYNIQEK